MKVLMETATLSPYAHWIFWGLVILLVIAHFRTRRKAIQMKSDFERLIRSYEKSQEVGRNLEESVARMESSVNILVQLIVGKNKNTENE